MRSTDDLPEAEKIRVDLTGAPQTMLATLYAKALDADADNSLLRDTWAKDVVRRIDYDWRKTTITPRNAIGVTLRTVHFDNWAREFLAAHERATYCTSVADWTAARSGWTRAPRSSGMTSTTPM